MSKGLEILRTLQQNLKVYPVDSAKFNEEKNAIDTIEKELKALEILRKYIIDTKKLMLVTTTNPYFYNNFGGVGVIPITQEEYELVKEALSWI